jgi:hypothetical protein
MKTRHGTRGSLSRNGPGHRGRPEASSRPPRAHLAPADRLRELRTVALALLSTTKEKTTMLDPFRLATPPGDSPSAPMAEGRSRGVSTRRGPRRLARFLVAGAALLTLGGCLFRNNRKAVVPMSGEGPLNDVHKQNIGKFVFSTKPIDRLKPDASALSTEFKSSDRLYGRFYLSGPVANEYVSLEMRSPESVGELVGAAVGGADDDHKQRACAYNVDLLVDGAKSKGWTFYRALEDDKQLAMSTQSIPLNPDPELEPEFRSFSMTYAANWSDFVRKLSPGRHVLRFELRTQCGSVYAQSLAAVGEFGLDVGDKPPTSGFTFDDVKAGMVNAKLEATALRALREHARNEGWKETFERVRITGRDWTIIRNSLTGIPLRRGLDVAAFARWPDGHCTYQSFLMTQEHDGRTYSQEFGVSGVGSQQPVDCR